MPRVLRPRGMQRGSSSNISLPVGDIVDAYAKPDGTTALLIYDDGTNTNAKRVLHAIQKGQSAPPGLKLITEAGDVEFYGPPGKGNGQGNSNGRSK